MKLFILFMAVTMGQAFPETLTPMSGHEIELVEGAGPHVSRFPLLAEVQGSTSKETKSTSAEPPAMPKAVKWILIVSGVSPLLAGIARLLQLKLKAKGS